jgi:NAD(P)-dependent dehydrogenase (short-subunit alcohol dehydrogenase family)
MNSLWSENHFMSNEVLVIGGTRGTGELVVKQLIKQGCPCTVLARNVAKAQGLFGDAVNIVYGDVTRPDSLEKVLAPAFAAIVYTVDITGGIGGRGFFADRQQVMDVVYGGVVNVVNALQAQDFNNHFVLLTTLGLKKPSLIMKLLNIIKPGVIQASQDKAAYLMKSGLPYTIVQAEALHDGAVSGRPLMLVQKETSMQMNYRISRQHLAQVLVATINNPVAIGKVFSVYGGQESRLSTISINEQLQKNHDYFH